MEEQARAPPFSQESDQSKQNPYHGYWTSTFDENATLQLELGRFFERLGKKLARHIGDRSGVPHAFWTGHWMSWWISVKCMDSIHGRCRHMIPECPTWANLPSIYDQAACGVCFNSHVTPLKKGAELFFSIVFLQFWIFFLGFVPGVIRMVFCRFVAWFLRNKLMMFHDICYILVLWFSFCMASATFCYLFRPKTCEFSMVCASICYI